MRVAVLADVHGNLPALEAVLRDVDAAGVDAIVLNGDLADGRSVLPRWHFSASRPSWTEPLRRGVPSPAWIRTAASEPGYRHRSSAASGIVLPEQPVMRRRLGQSPATRTAPNDGSGASGAPRARDGAWHADRIAFEAIRRRLPILSG